MIKVGINGFGRIGRLTLRAINEKYPNEIQVVAINDLADSKTNCHLFKWDSTYGPYKGDARLEGEDIVVDGNRIHSYREKDPASVNWSGHDVQVVLEASGVFTDKEKAAKHISGSVKKVIISAPAKGEDFTVVLGVNDDAYDPASHHVISNASCTTNCIAPMTKVLVDNFGIECGLMTTIHSYTNDQRVQDQMHKDLRRARAAGQNMIPTSTGAAKALGVVIPAVKGKLHGFSVRVPTPTVSVVDLVATLSKEGSVDEINDAMRAASSQRMKGILQVVEEPLTSSDFIGSPFSCSIDAELTMRIGDRMAKVIGWYDNEWGYSVRCADLIKLMGEKGL
jgi:glyceraldehyde 3-phosphate dehydrogenase